MKLLVPTISPSNEPSHHISLSHPVPLLTNLPVRWHLNVPILPRIIGELARPWTNASLESSSTGTKLSAYMTENDDETVGRKAEARQARLWEDTIMIALRDAQWLRCQEINGKPYVKTAARRPAPAIPSGFIKLDGRAESKIGDVTLALDERLFVIEVKSSRAQVRDEWCHSGHFRPKKVYKRLSDLVDHCNQRDPPLDDDDPMDHLLLSSLNGHLVAFWGQMTDELTSQLRNTIIMVPYLQAMVTSLTKTDEFEWGMINRLPISKACAITCTKPPRIAEPSDLGRDICRLFYVDADGNHNFGKHPLGLSAEDFQDYVNYLCLAYDWSTAGEPINAIVLSSHGTFFQVISSTNDLAALLSINFVQERAPEHAPKTVAGRKGKQEPKKKDIEHEPD